MLIVGGFMLLLALEFVLLRRVQTAQAAPMPRADQLVRAWWGELRTAAAIFFWRQPFRATAEGDFLPHAPGRRGGVVLVHGLFCNRAFWNPWMRELRRLDIAFVAPTLEPVLGSIDGYTQTIDAAVTAVQASTGGPIVMVGHSMGGLAIRAWLAQARNAERVHRVVTIGTPHQGTWMARFGRASSRGEMALASPWLARLAARETPALRARYTCFFGHCDNVVFPASAACLAGATNVHLAATAHVRMAFDPRVFEAVCRALDQ